MNRCEVASELQLADNGHHAHMTATFQSSADDLNVISNRVRKQEPYGMEKLLSSFEAVSAQN